MKIRTTALVSALCAASLPMLAPIVASGSSHREAPNITGLPKVDSTDFYLFNSYEAGPQRIRHADCELPAAAGSVRRPELLRARSRRPLYEIHVDSDGDAVEDLTFQFRFKNRLAENNTGKKLMIGDQSVAVPLKNIGPISAQDVSNLNFNESYTLTLVRGDRRSGQSSPVTRTGDGATEFGKPFDFVGTKTFGSIAGYEQYAKSFIHEIAVPGCAKPGRVFVGQRDESFVVNLGQVFDLVNFVPVDADVPPDQGGLPGGIGIKQDPKNDIISDANITTFALELPAACLTGNGNGVIGGWTSASLRQGRVLNPTASFAKPDVQRRRLDAGLAPVDAAGQRAGDRHARQGSLQRERAEGRRPVRQVRDQSDVAGAAGRAVQQGSERHPRRVRRSRTWRRPTCRARTWSRRS